MPGEQTLGDLVEIDDCTVLHDDQPWSHPAPVNPEPVAGMPHGLALHGLALLPAAAAMAGWKLRGRDA
jgi:hypothetical protein